MPIFEKKPRYLTIKDEDKEKESEDYITVPAFPILNKCFTIFGIIHIKAWSINKD